VHDQVQARDERIETYRQRSVVQVGEQALRDGAVGLWKWLGRVAFGGAVGL